jgi:hypothetical protein
VYSLSSKTDHIRVTTVERLDQGHLHPELEVLRLTFLRWELNPDLHGWEESTLAKSYSNTVLIAIRNFHNPHMEVKPIKIIMRKKDLKNIFRLKYNREFNILKQRAKLNLVFCRLYPFSPSHQGSVWVLPSSLCS